VPPEKPVTTTVATLPAQEPFVIAAGAIRPWAVPIRTVVTSVSDLISLSAPRYGGTPFLLHPITAIKLKPVKPNK
jgi:hypothetical protein